MAQQSKGRRERRIRRHLRVRRKVVGTSERPRLAVFRSLSHIEGQVIDDSKGLTVVGLSTLASDVRSQSAEMSKAERGRLAGRLLAERAREKGITKVVFDRGGYLYHGRVKAFAEGAREGGLEF
jgi:large subunit ribosomal protein L18